MLIRIIQDKSDRLWIFESPFIDINSSGVMGLFDAEQVTEGIFLRSILSFWINLFFITILPKTDILNPHT